MGSLPARLAAGDLPRLCGLKQRACTSETPTAPDIWQAEVQAEGQAEGQAELCRTNAADRMQQTERRRDRTPSSSESVCKTAVWTKTVVA